MKARFKTIVLSAIGAIAAFSAVTTTSCEPDKCKAIVCAYGGVCKEGTCICPTGYEGYQCETITRERYKGVWTVFEKGTRTLPAQYDVVIEYGPTMIDLNIRNFYNKFKEETLSVTIKGDTLYIPQQTIQDHVIQGGGYITKSNYYGENGLMKIAYTVREPDGAVNDFGVNAGVVSEWNR